MRKVAFELALIGAIMCAGFGWNAKWDMRNRPDFRAVRMAERELSKPGADERVVLLWLGIFPDRYPEAKIAYRWALWLSYALLAAFPLGVLGILLVRHGKGWLAGPVLLLAAAGPIVCVVRLASYNRDILLFGLPGVALALAGLSSFFIRAQPAAGQQEKPTAPLPAPVAAAPPATTPALLSVACPTCATTLKYPPLPRPRSIRCPRCKAVVAVPAASPVEEAQMVEPEPEPSTPEPKQQPGPQSASPG